MPTQRRRSAPLTLAAVVGLATAVWAGGPGPEERLLVLGRCDGDAACTWNCDPTGDQTNVGCGAAGGTCALPAPTFAARLRLSVDDQHCPGNGGGKLTLALAGHKADGSDFSIPDTTIDFCGVPEEVLSCGGTRGLCELSLPRQTVFQCTTFFQDGLLDELAIPDTTWLPYSNFPATIAQALRDAFPGVGGEPVIASAVEQSFSDRTASPDPSVRELCITGTFVTPTAALDTPSALDGLTTTTASSSLAFGDCPTLPLVTTTTTTLPGGTCDGLAGDAAVGCLIDHGATGCANATTPAAIARLRTKAAALIGRALAAARPRQRTARLNAARRSLVSARQKAKHAKPLAGACRDGLVPALDAAIAVIDGLRAI